MKFIDINREGSPPRMRGKDHGLQHIAPDAGITPACAGKSLLRVVGQCYEPGITPARAGKRFQFVLRLHAPGDYPRVCGEKDKAAEKAQHLRGSPPRMQGKVYFLQQGDFTIRITPACAGKRIMEE